MLANRALATPKVALATKRGGRAGLPLEPRIVGGDGRPKGFERGLGINPGFGGVRRPLGLQGFAGRAPLREPVLREGVDLVAGLIANFLASRILEIGPWAGHTLGPLRGAVVVDHLFLCR